uniref:Uncharacterized protein n=1 Tax=Timema shepardi TaxID=629360 RepID=A0A7R9G3E7_TIMSH|nr:unnamed protein product [Timema shepardi]
MRVNPATHPQLNPAFPSTSTVLAVHQWTQPISNHRLPYHTQNHPTQSTAASRLPLCSLGVMLSIT